MTCLLVNQHSLYHTVSAYMSRLLCTITVTQSADLQIFSQEGCSGILWASFRACAHAQQGSGGPGPGSLQCLAQLGWLPFGQGRPWQCSLVQEGWPPQQNWLVHVGPHCFDFASNHFSIRAQVGFKHHEQIKLLVFTSHCQCFLCCQTRSPLVCTSGTIIDAHSSANMSCIFASHALACIASSHIAPTWTI